jgi:hypothetical protein
MSNRSSSHQHGCHRIKRLQPTKKRRMKENKNKCRTRQITRQAEIQAALSEK